MSLKVSLKVPLEVSLKVSFRSLLSSSFRSLFRSLLERLQKRLQYLRRVLETQGNLIIRGYTSADGGAWQPLKRQPVADHLMVSLD